MYSKILEQALYSKLTGADQDFIDEIRSIRKAKNKIRYKNLMDKEAEIHSAKHGLIGLGIGALGGGLIGAGAKGKHGGIIGATIGGVVGATAAAIHGNSKGLNIGLKKAQSGDKEFHKETEDYIKRYSGMDPKSREERRNYMRTKWHEARKAAHEKELQRQKLEMYKSVANGAFETAKYLSKGH